MEQLEAKHRRLITGHSSRQLGPASPSRPPEDAATSAAIQSQILSLIQHPSLTHVQIAQITVSVWQRHALHLESQGASIENKTFAQKIEGNPKKAIGLISEIEVIPLQPIGQAEAETQSGHAKSLVSQNRNSHIPADDLSDVSKSFEAQLSSLMDLHQPSARAEKIGDDAQPQQPPSKISQPTSHESLSSVQRPWFKDVEQVLRSQFRMTQFRHNQLEAIHATLAGKDVFVLMPTGGGKSLCYQLPAIIQSGKTRGITLVVSPLISLMQDQVDHLRAFGIRAATFYGETKPEDRNHIMATLRTPHPERHLSLLYVTPEMMRNSESFRRCLETLSHNKRLARLVIDEAHCVSQWGHDFRPDYKALGNFRKEFPHVPLVALTATATRNVIADIKSHLGMEDCETFSQSFNRPNLYYEVLKKDKNTVRDIATLIMGKYQGKSGIIYTLSRKSTEKIATKLQEFGIAAYYYHASVPAEEKVRIQKDCQAGNILVIVATIAFGMGIDKPDVRFVIHESIPKSLEGYYQETGRAGRDGRPSECYLYFSGSDVLALLNLIRDGDGSEQQKARQGNLLEKAAAFCRNQTDCRRVGILRYFGESFSAAECGETCDNCKANGKFEARQDFTKYAIATLMLIRHHGRLTSNQCVNFLLGRKTNIERNGLEQYYGMAKHIAKDDMHRIFDRLATSGALNENNVIHRTSKMAIQYFQLGPNAHALLSGEQSFTMITKTRRDSQTASSVTEKPAGKPIPTHRHVRFTRPVKSWEGYDSEGGETSKYFQILYEERRRGGTAAIKVRRNV